VSLFLAHMDYEHCIRSFQIQISTGKWFIWVVTSWTIATTSSQVITELYPERFGRLLLILLIGDEVTYYHVDVISTGCYTTMLRYYSMELSFSTCYLQVMSPGQTLRQMSPSPMYVNIPGHARSNQRT